MRSALLMKQMKHRPDHETKAKRQKYWNEFGYGLMWLLLGVFLEMLYLLDQIYMNLYHVIAAITFLAAIYKFYKGFKKYREVRDV